MRERSGDSVGQCSNRISCVLRKARTQRATCNLALFCWKMAFKWARREVSTIRRKISEMYRIAFKLSLMQPRYEHIVYSMDAQTIPSGAKLL